MTDYFNNLRREGGNCNCRHSFDLKWSKNSGSQLKIMKVIMKYQISVELRA